MKRYLQPLGLAVAALALVVSSTTAEAQLFGKKNKDGKPEKKDEDTKLYDGNADLAGKLGGEYKGIKHAVGVRDFDNDAGWGAEWNLPRNMAIMLESALMNTGRFVLVEREKLDIVLDEQELQARGLSAQTEGNVAGAGKLRPAKYIATGQLVEVEGSESGVGGGLNIKGFRLGGNHAKMQVTIIAKLVDTTTGEVVSSKRILGKAGRTGVNVGYTHRGVGGDLGGFEKTPAAEAIQDCLNQAAVFIAREMETMPVDATVVMVKDGRVIINRGSVHNFQPGVVLVMTEKGEDLIDPDTGEILEKAQGKAIGQIRVDKVSEKVSYCSVVTGEANPARGTVASVASMPAELAAASAPVPDAPRDTVTAN